MGRNPVAEVQRGIPNMQWLPKRHLIWEDEYTCGLQVVCIDFQVFFFLNTKSLTLKCKVFVNIIWNNEVQANVPTYLFSYN